MAVFGQLESLKNLFKKTQALQELYCYLHDAQDQNSPVFERILQTKGEVKIPLSDGMFAIEQSYELKEPTMAIFETHMKYVDFQLVVQGSEIFFLGDKKNFIESSHHTDRDMINYHPNFEQISKLFLESGVLAVFFDYDVHAGGIWTEERTKTKVFKTVVKVPNEILKLKF